MGKLSFGFTHGASPAVQADGRAGVCSPRGKGLLWGNLAPCRTPCSSFAPERTNSHIRKRGDAVSCGQEPQPVAGLQG